MAAKTTRTPGPTAKWTSELETFLLNEVSDKKAALYGDAAGCGKGSKYARQAWSEIRVGLAARGFFQDENQISKKVSNLKQNANKKDGVNKNGTGGGKDPEPLTDGEKLYLDLFDSHDSTNGHENGTDMALVNKQKREAAAAAASAALRQDTAGVRITEQDGTETSDDIVPEDLAAGTAAEDTQLVAKRLVKSVRPRQNNNKVPTRISGLTDVSSQQSTAKYYQPPQKRTPSVVRITSSFATSLAPPGDFQPDSVSCSSQVTSQPRGQTAKRQEQDLNMKWGRNLDIEFRKKELEVELLQLKIKKLKRELDVPEE